MAGERWTVLTIERGRLRTSSYMRPIYSPSTPRHRSSRPPTKNTAAPTPKPATATELLEKSIKTARSAATLPARKKSAKLRRKGL